MHTVVLSTGLEECSFCDRSLVDVEVLKVFHIEKIFEGFIIYLGISNAEGL
jgi:hypothetical protein